MEGFGVLEGRFVFGVHVEGETMHTYGYIIMEYARNQMHYNEV